MAHRQEYYKHLQDVGAKGTWAEWIIYILEGVAKMSAFSLQQLKEINTLVEATAEDINKALPKYIQKNWLRYCLVSSIQEKAV